jgi:hypothetical protein
MKVGAGYRFVADVGVCACVPMMLTRMLAIVTWRGAYPAGEHVKLCYLEKVASEVRSTFIRQSPPSLQ